MYSETAWLQDEEGEVSTLEETSFMESNRHGVNNSGMSRVGRFIQLEEGQLEGECSGRQQELEEVQRPIVLRGQHRSLWLRRQQERPSSARTRRRGALAGELKLRDSLLHTKKMVVVSSFEVPADCKAREVDRQPTLRTMTMIAGSETAHRPSSELPPTPVFP